MGWRQIPILGGPFFSKKMPKNSKTAIFECFFEKALNTQLLLYFKVQLPLFNVNAATSPVEILLLLQLLVHVGCGGAAALALAAPPVIESVACGPPCKCKDPAITSSPPAQVPIMHTQMHRHPQHHHYTQHHHTQQHHHTPHGTITMHTTTTWHNTPPHSTTTNNSTITNYTQQYHHTQQHVPHTTLASCAVAVAARRPPQLRRTVGQRLRSGGLPVLIRCVAYRS